MDLVDEQHRTRIVLEFLDDLLQALLEIAAVTGAGEQRAHVEREDGGIGERLGHLAFDDPLGQTFGDRRLADAGIAHVERIVLGPAAQHLDGAVDLGMAPDERIDAPVLGLLVQVDAIGLQGIGRLLAGTFILFARGLGVCVALLGTARRTHRRGAGPLADPVRDVVDGVIARHLLLLQEEGGMAFPFREDRHQHIGAGHFLASGRLHMDDGALDDALEAGGRLRILVVSGDQVGKFVVDVVGNGLAQGIQVDVTRTHDRRSIGIVDQCQQQMLERGIFVMPLVRKRQCLV